MREIFRLITISIERLTKMRSIAQQGERVQIEAAIDHLQAASDALSAEPVS